VSGRPLDIRQASSKAVRTWRSSFSPPMSTNVAFCAVVISMGGTSSSLQFPRVRRVGAGPLAAHEDKQRAAIQIRRRGVSSVLRSRGSRLVRAVSVRHVL
jgi:hypothetical protein